MRVSRSRFRASSHHLRHARTFGFDRTTSLRAQSEGILHFNTELARALFTFGKNMNRKGRGLPGRVELAIAVEIPTIAICQTGISTKHDTRSHALHLQ